LAGVSEVTEKGDSFIYCVKKHTIEVME